MASLALRRLWERLEAGTCPVRPADVVMLMRLAREVERERDSVVPDPRWTATIRELLWLVRSHLRDGWPQFAADVRSSETLKGLWGDPRPGPGP